MVKAKGGDCTILGRDEAGLCRQLFVLEPNELTQAFASVRGKALGEKYTTR